MNKKRQRHYKRKAGFLILSHLLPNFEIQKNYRKEPRFKKVGSKSNLPKIPKYGIYAMYKIYKYATAVTQNLLP